MGIKGEPASGLQGEGITLPVDLIRTVAIILVILLHAATEGIPNLDIMSAQGIQLWWTADVYNSISRVCVPLFIMLTGALLLQPSKVEEPLGVFFKKRWMRIGIPILFWAAVYFAWRFFVNGEVLTLSSIVQGVFTGPYYQFWYLYVLVGLYLLTPVIRVVVAHAKWGTIKYFLVVWFLGTGLFPLLTLAVNLSVAVSFFLITGLVGYFILGAYVAQLRSRRWTLSLIFALSTLFTILGTFFLVGTLGESYSQFFLDASSFNVILASVALFLILASIPNQTLITRFPRGIRVLKIISENTLPIYLFEVIVLETLQRGFLGFTISVATINPILEMPLITAVTLGICLAVIVPLKKIPYVKQIIG